MGIRITRIRLPLPPNAGGSTSPIRRGWLQTTALMQTCSPQHWGTGRGRQAILAIMLIFAFAIAALPAPARADALDDEVRAIAKQLRCPVCAGETVADSNAEVSVQMRGIIREKLQQGETPDQIKAYFVARYGESILAEPPARGFTLGVWLMPILALIVGLGIVGAVLRSWLRRGGGEPLPAPAVAAPRAADDERLERELEQFRRGGAHG
jgi:cytochrome c-type biogenesis protein CcmH